MGEADELDAQAIADEVDARMVAQAFVHTFGPRAGVDLIAEALEAVETTVRGQILSFVREHADVGPARFLVDARRDLAAATGPAGSVAFARLAARAMTVLLQFEISAAVRRELTDAGKETHQ